MVPKLVADEPKALGLDRCIIAPGDYRNVALAREVEDAGVDTADTAKAEKKDVGSRHDASRSDGCKEVCTTGDAG